MPRPVTRTQAALCVVSAPASTPAACAGDPAAHATAADEVDWLCELPDALLQILLRALACSGLPLRGGDAEGVAKSLLRLAATCKHLRCAVAALDDDAWRVRAAIARALCERDTPFAFSTFRLSPFAHVPDPSRLAHAQPLVLARFLTPDEPPPASWRAHFLSQRGKQCRSRSCTTVSDYVFPLLGASYRLCERCEAADPAYALLTAAQAADGFRLSAEELSGLPSREVRGLRSRAVEKRLRMLGQATLYLRSHVVALAAERDKARFDNDSGDDSEDDAEAEEEQFALDDEEEDGEGAPARRRAPAQSAEEARAARKANKAAVKAANRERRQSKAAALASPAEPRRTYAALSRSPGAALPPRPGSSPQQSAFRAGSSPGVRTPGRGSKAAHVREAARSLGVSPSSGGVLARAVLEQELGEFGISGLERAD